MADVLFVNPSTRGARGITSVAVTFPPLGLGYLAAAVESRGHRAQIIDANAQRIAVEEIAAHISRKPDIIGLTANILTLKIALAYAEVLREAFPNAQVVMGGPQVSSVGKILLEKNTVLDALIMGEGEATIAELADRIGQENLYAGVLGVIYRQGERIVDNGPRPLITDVDSIAPPAYHLLPPLSSYQSRNRAHPVGFIFTSRGCPAACTFCYRSFGSQWRPRSPENVVAEIALLRERYGIRQLDIVDDNFSFDQARARRIFELIIAKGWDLKICLHIGVRVHTLSRDLLEIMKKAGVFKFGFGIESGDATILKDIKKGISLECAVNVVKTARSLDMVTQAFFIIGFPDDSPETMQRTIDFAKKLNPHYASFAICTPFPGTEMYEDVLRRDVLLDDMSAGIDLGLFSLKAFLKYEKTTPGQVAEYCERAWREFYLRPVKIIDILTTVRSVRELYWLGRVLADVFESWRGKRHRKVMPLK